MRITTDDKKEYPICEVLELDADTYADYLNRMRNLPDSLRTEDDPGVEHLYLLIVGEDYKNGVVIDFSGRAYEGFRLLPKTHGSSLKTISVSLRITASGKARKIRTTETGR